MNSTISQLAKRKSIREFTGEKISDEDLELIFKTAQRCPTSINGQQISLVYIRDKEKLKEIAEICGGQKHIETADVFVVIVVDFNRTAFAVEQTSVEQNIHKSAEGITVGAVDAGIMLNAIQVSAEALGYGTTSIGAIRNAPEKFIEMLNLPSKTFPVVGTIIGTPTSSAKEMALKPRVPYESFVFKDIYNDEKIKDGVLKYEKQLKDYRVANDMVYMHSYCQSVADFYQNIYFRKIAENYKKQSFEFKD